MPATLSLSTRVTRNQNIIAADMDGETVMMSIEHGEYYGLTGIGPFLWELLTEPMSIGALLTRVLEEYDVDEATCRADVSAFVDDLITKGVLRLAE